VSSDDQRQALATLLRATSDLAASGDTTATKTLWLAFEALARSLAKLTELDHRLCDYGRLVAVLMRCLHQLKGGLSAGEIEALAATYGLSEQGCQLLEQATKNNPEFVAGFAEQTPFWPVLIGTKKMYHNAANRYLRKIRVGQKSILPTVSTTKIEANDRWTELAVMLIEDIALFRKLLRRAKGAKALSAFQQKMERDLRLKARCSPGVMKLRSPLDRNNQSAWWKEAKPMLISYWDENPQQAFKDWKLAGGCRGEYDRTYAIRRVREAFKSLSRSRKSK
jgi:HPt (histidine-containing phosphotransfer) domain-containing protein